MVSALPYSYLPRLPKRCVFFAASPACWGMGSLKTAKSLFLDPPEHMYYFPQFRYSAILYYSVILYGIIVFVLCSRNMYNTKVLTVLISYYTIVQIILDTIIVKCRAECTVARLKSPIRFSLAVWLRQIQLDFRIFSGDVILYSLLTISPVTLCSCVTMFPSDIDIVAPGLDDEQWVQRNVITRG